MLSFVLSRNLCQRVVAEVTYGPLLRAFTTSNPKYREATDNVVTYTQLRTMLSNRDIQLFDVRNPDEYRAGHIPHAVNMPLGNLEESLKLSPEHFKQRFEVKTPGKDDNNIVFHCKGGNRSAKALDIAHQLGFSKARHYKGGYADWVEQERK
ncbi:thiosulfate:glutathione sulfurtransferase [Brachyistius frenatus]|uniref:thiosulfate:glutathione sulfurtransferase n=1 Tax=Brachyistius frenatus TaxID=100188 RepID=UPI0037E73C94